jgi:glycosyltransferase involved in cell wall biosynthesis
MSQEAPARARILHIATRYLRGGSERRISDAMHSLDEFAHDLIVGPESDLGLAKSDLPVEDVLVESRLIRQPNPYSDAIALTRLIRVIRERQPDIVFTHQSKAGALGRIASRFAGRVPAVHSLSMASFGPGYSKVQSAVFRWLEKRLASYTAAYSGVGSDLMGRYRDAGVPDDKLHLIRSGVPIPRIDEPKQELKQTLARQYGAPADRPWVIHVGSLEARKNVMMLPRVLRLTHEMSANGLLPHLLIVGDGPLRSQLEREIESEGLGSHCTLTGYVTGVGPLMRASDTLILLSSVEGLPQVLVQAAAVDTPFVAFDVDGVREVLALGAQGTVVELGDVDAAVQAVTEQLARPAAHAELNLESWSPERIRGAYRSLLKEVLDGQTAVDRGA